MHTGVVLLASPGFGSKLTLEPSEADKKITGRVMEALELVDINILDHQILNNNEKYATIDVYRLGFFRVNYGFLTGSIRNFD